MADGDASTNGTPGRLCSMHKDPKTAPNRWGWYGSNKDKLADSLNRQSNYACEQWKAGGGVVGPEGSEGNAFFGRFNDPSSSAYEENQAFGYQHDLQAADAEQQKFKYFSNYDKANRESAVAGFLVLKATHDVKKALRTTQVVWASYGFAVRQTY